MSWLPFKTANQQKYNGIESNRTPSDQSASRDASHAAFDREKGLRDPRPAPSLDSIGQRNESLRQRISEMADRLEDMRSLHEHFSSIVEPLSAISDELPKASMRIAELEALLTQERQAGQAARREAADLSGRTSTISNELSQAAARLATADADIDVKHGVIDELRIALRDKALAADNFERQLFAETDRAKALAGESKALRAETQAADQAFSRASSDLTDARERLSLFDQENRRLQVLSEDQSARLVDLGIRHDELTTTAHAEREKLRLLEGQIATEIATREKNDLQYEATIGTLRNERAANDMKLEAALNRLNSTENLMTQLRTQLREKEESGRIAERNFKEASIEKSTLERRIEGVQNELARAVERFLDMQKIRVDLDGRCDMLNKAIAAKDSGLEQATSRIGALGDRIDQMTRKHETERAEFEAANRRLLEELQAERSERAMALGALNISRESRSALQKQYDALKRSGRGQSHDGIAAINDMASEQTEIDSNVRFFSPSGKSE